MSQNPNDPNTPNSNYGSGPYNNPYAPPSPPPGAANPYASPTIPVPNPYDPYVPTVMSQQASSPNAQPGAYQAPPHLQLMSVLSHTAIRKVLPILVRLHLSPPPQHSDRIVVDSGSSWALSLG